MVDATYIRFAASDRSYFSIIKKEIHSKALKAAFDQQKLNDLDLIVSELTSNLQKHAKDGEILAGIFQEQDNCYIELLSIDQGPGIANPQNKIADGSSTDLNPDMGLGRVKLLSDKFDIYTTKGWGTIVLSRLYKNAPQQRSGILAKIEVRPLIVAMPGQTVSGDGTYYQVTEKHFKMLVADGLGHGADANYAVTEGVKAFKASTSHSPAQIIKDIHLSILKTRGMVASVVVFDFEKKTWTMAGVGNITSRMSNFIDIKNQMSHNGIIGHNIPNMINDQVISLNDYHQITLCSDGMKSRWELSKYPGINRSDLSIQAAAIYKDFASQADDMSVVITKINQL